MKTLQKYTNMAFLLLSVATIVPAYTHQEDIIEQKNTETVWYKRPEVSEAVLQTISVIGVVILIAEFHNLITWRHSKGAYKGDPCPPGYKTILRKTIDSLIKKIS